MSRTDSVIGSDRFVAVWELADAPGETPAASPAGGRSVGPTVATADDPLPDAPVVFVAIPEDVQELKQRDPDAALAWRASTRRAFVHYLGGGYGVTDFERRCGDRPPRYRLERHG